MDPAGLVVGIVGLAGLFNTVIDVINRVHTYKSYRNDSLAFDALFQADCARMKHWGREVGLAPDGQLPTHHSAALDTSTEAAVKTLLEYLLYVVDPGRGSKTGEYAELEGEGQFSVPPTPLNTLSTSTRSKLKWAIQGKSARKERVEIFGALVQKLHDLVPVAGISLAPTGDRASQNVIHQDVNQLEILSNYTDFRDVLKTLQNQNLKDKVERQRKARAWIVGQETPNESYNESLRKWLPGTCKWIFDVPKVKAWLSPDDENRVPSPVLWIHGHAGFGKTIVSSQLVKHLSSAGDGPVAHYFFASGRYVGDDPFIVVRSWIAQLMSSDEHISEMVCERHDDKQVAGQSTIISLLQEILQEVPGCTLVVDGLDECAAAQQGNSPFKHFIEDINNALSDTTRLLIVSRDSVAIRDALSNLGAEILSEFKIQRTDVELDTAAVARHIIFNTLPNKSVDVRNELSETMSSRCEGQFLWLEMQKSYLRKGMSKDRLQDAIKKTPTDLIGLYDRYWKDISNLPEQDMEQAFSILRWVAFARRPLRAEELVEAVLINADSDEYPVADVSDDIDAYVETEILGLCSPLIQVTGRDTDHIKDGRLQEIQIAHFTVKEYLMRHLPDKTLSANEALRLTEEQRQGRILAQMCLRYVRSSVWEYAESDKAPAFQAAFLDYAVSSWYISLASDPDAQGHSQMFDLALEFMSERHPTWALWRARIALLDQQMEQKRIQKGAKDSKRKVSSSAVPNWRIAQEIREAGPLYYALRCDLDSLAVRIIEGENGDQENRWSGYGQALCIACRKGLLPIVDALLDGGADLETRDNQNRTPLNTAALYGRLEIVERLLKKGASIVEKSEDGPVVLVSAVLGGNADVVKLLIQNGANVSAMDSRRRTPILEAAVKGRSDIVKQLLANGADMFAVSDNSWTAVLAAAYYGHVDVMDLLINNGASFDDRLEDGQTLVHVAARREESKILRLLIEKGIDLTMTDNYGLTSVHHAAALGHTDVLQLLVSSGADTSAVDKNGETPLHLATVLGHAKAVNLLLDSGADVTAVTKTGCSALHITLWHNHTDATEILIRNGIGLSLGDDQGNTPLHFAAYKGRSDAARQLVTAGVDLSCVNGNGRTPLHLALLYHQLDIAQLLIEKGAGISVSDNLGMQPLHCAALKGCSGAVRQLIAAGVDHSCVNKDGRTPFHLALVYSHPDTAQIFIDAEACFPIRDIHGRTPLHCAAARGYLHLVQLLIGRGFDPQQTCRDGSTSLHAAAIDNHRDMINLLIDHSPDLINSSDKLGRTALFDASRSGSIKAVQALLSHERVDSAGCDYYGNTALSTAVRNGHKEIVALLIEKECAGDIDVLSGRFSHHPLLWWSQRGVNRDVVKVLEQHLAKYDMSFQHLQSSFNHADVDRSGEAQRWCDICTLSILENDTYYKCGICVGGDFDICTECHRLGFKCLDASHSLKGVNLKDKSTEEPGKEQNKV